MKNRRKFTSLILFLLFTLAAFFFVVFFNENSKEYETTLFSMDTVMSISAYGESAKSALEKAGDRINEIEKEMSVTVEGSDIYKINHSFNEFVRVSPDTATVIRMAQKVSQMSDGSLDVSIFPIVKKWGFTTGIYEILSTEEADSLLERVDYKKISITDSNEVNVPKGLEIDLGALAKGYASDEAAKLLRENGVKSALLNLGGNICAVGSKPDGSDWNIAIKNPLSDDDYAGILTISDKCAVTSGSYERFFTGEDGKIYHHIIDPATGFPADSDLVSITVVCDSGLYADALSTALFVAGTERAADIWREALDFEYVGIMKDGSLVVTEGLKDCFSTNYSFSYVKR